MLPQGFSRNPRELSISSHRGRYRLPRETGGSRGRVASSLYRLLGTTVGNGYAEAKADHIFRDLVDATATVTITASAIEVRFQKRAHNPLLLAAGFDRMATAIPWLGGKSLRLIFGR